MKSAVTGSIYRLLLVVGLSAVVLALGSPGCAKKAPTPAEPNAPAASQTPSPDTPKPPEAKVDKVVATVNGMSIMESQVQRRIDLEYKPILAQLRAQNPDLAAQQEKMLQRNLTDRLIDEQLLDEQAKKAGIEVTEEELTAEMTRQLAARQPPMTVPEYQKIVEAQGGDFAEMKAYLSGNMRRYKLLDPKLRAVVVTDEDAKKYYDENPKNFQTPEQVRASHILISTRPTDPNSDPNQVKTQARLKAEDLLKKVQDGADFAALAKENSQDSWSKDKGGDLGLFKRSDMVKPFEDAAFALKPGQISPLVETQSGYHIIKVTEHQDPNQVPFDKAKGQIVEQLTQQKRQEAVRQYVESLRQGAKIEFPAGTATPAPQAIGPVLASPADANKQ